jgi:ribosomal protein S18 acetylase RimI-like enzyme
VGEIGFDLQSCGANGIKVGSQAFKSSTTIFSLYVGCLEARDALEQRAGMDLIIRPANPDDVAAVRQLLVETWHDTYDVLIGHDQVCAVTERWHTLDAIRLQVADPSLLFAIAKFGSTDLIGHALASSDSSSIEVLRIYVRPSFQGLGIGTQLFAYVGRSFGWSRPITLSVEEKNERAISIYRKWGFEIISSFRDDGRSVVRMRRVAGEI